MILEFSLSLILNPNDLGFFIGPYHLESDPLNNVVEARTLILKLWFVMFQITLYGS